MRVERQPGKPFVEERVSRKRGSVETREDYFWVALKESSVRAQVRGPHILEKA